MQRNNIFLVLNWSDVAVYINIYKCEYAPPGCYNGSVREGERNMIKFADAYAWVLGAVRKGYSVEYATEMFKKLNLTIVYDQRKSPRMGGGDLAVYKRIRECRYLPAKCYDGIVERQEGTKMKTVYGSLNNRLNEGRQLVNEIKVGDGVTEYMYTDRHAYEVTKVVTQNNIFIRKLDTQRIDTNGMSDSQEYRFISNNKNAEIELVKRNGCWYRVENFDRKTWLKNAEKDNAFKSANAAYNYYKAMSGLTAKQLEKIEQGKEVKKYVKMNNISIGVTSEYYDYSF